MPLTPPREPGGFCCVVGARPNFIKMAPVVLELRRRGAPVFLVHTGQHFDANMSQVFFSELGLPRPDAELGAGSGSHARQTARVMTGFEELCLARSFDRVVVAGDVNSTLAAALTAAKLGLPVAHVEAGLRSFDRGMPEEINRLLTDHLCDLLFTTEPSGGENLRDEGIAQAKIHFVGNCMVDSLLRHKARALALSPWREHGLEEGAYALLTLHRPSNVDEPESLAGLIGTLNELAGSLPILFPVHPRTRARLGGVAVAPRIKLTEPLPYLNFLGLLARARIVLTDSGGIQEESTALGIPCLTLRENTERPVTVSAGSNRVVGTRPSAIAGAFREALADRREAKPPPPLWDGRAAERIADILLG